MEPARIEDISDTAFLTCHARALETERPDAVFRDPLAATLLTERGRALGEMLQGSFMRGWSIVVRTVLIDDFIGAAVAGGVDTVLNLGAGLDTRPYRMDVPSSLRWVEVDQPHVIQFKTERLNEHAPRCRLERVGLDLTDVPRRHALFADLQGRAEALLVVTEGVVPYFPNDAVGQLALDLHGIENTRGWIVDHIPAAVLAFRKNQPPAKQAEPMKLQFEPPDWFAFFEAHGWRAGEVRTLLEEGLRVGRPMPLPPGTPPMAPGDDAEAARTFPGYVMLEPIR